MGIKVGGGELVAGKTIMDAQLSAFMTGKLSFSAQLDGTATSTKFPIKYGAYIFYNIGYSAKAQILGLIDWALKDRLAYHPDKKVKIHEGKYDIDLNPPRRRTLGEDKQKVEDEFSANNSSMLALSNFARDDGDSGMIALNSTTGPKDHCKNLDSDLLQIRRFLTLRSILYLSVLQATAACGFQSFDVRALVHSHDSQTTAV